MLEDITAWLGDHKAALFWIGVASVVMLVGSALLLPLIVGRLPADYFVNPAARRQRQAEHPVRRILVQVARNGLGIVLILAGAAMLVFPGQGVLTILMGLLFLDLPGDRDLLCQIVRRKTVFAAMNWLRKKRHRPPFLAPRRLEKDAACAIPPFPPDREDRAAVLLESPGPRPERQGTASPARARHQPPASGSEGTTRTDVSA